MENVSQELLPFLQKSTRIEIKLTATRNVLALSASLEGRKFMIENRSILEAILRLTKDENALVVGDCYNTIVNLSSEDHVIDVILQSYNVVPEFLRVICDRESQFSHKACMILNNLTRFLNGAEKVAEFLPNFDKDSEENVPDIDKLVEVFCISDYNKHKMSLNYIAPFLGNLCQLSKVRKIFLDPEKNRIQKLLPFLSHTSMIRRGGISTLLRNCSFEYESHEWLLSDKVDLLSHVLLPLAGPEEFTDEENDSLPLDLQYLPSDKTREPDPDVRNILLDTLILLCADKPGRTYLKSKNVYLIIRELHKWVQQNKEDDVSETCEKLVQILISDEPDEGSENLLTCEIPEKHRKALEST
uniref:Protein HGH1 homolog n=1 Tax=Phallusia mammillata TaxID=59560 RepID=A0A6F9DF28_9ASCI|nr:protein HGH1 homolog [Phallusia mammillata]